MRRQKLAEKGMKGAVEGAISRSQWNDGYGKVAILDPFVSAKDPVSGIQTMNEVITILGPTKNPNLGGVDERCINSAAVDPFNKCAVFNSEDGHLYTWFFRAFRYRVILRESQVRRRRSGSMSDIDLGRGPPDVPGAPRRRCCAWSLGRRRSR
jgi:hypothetical protein